MSTVFVRSVHALGIAVVAGLAVLASPAAGSAQTPATGLRGSDDTLVGGRSTLRAGDPTSSGGTIVQGSPDVLINGRPAATVGDGCSTGAPNVFVNGKPLARVGDACPGK